jgi:predicted TIM-barrel fold metal-dependent hydrolase
MCARLLMAPLICGVVIPATALSEPARPPIIDVHLHAQELWAPPGTEATEMFASVFEVPFTGIRAAESTDDLKRRTLAALERHNIVKAVTSGRFAEEYRRAQPDRILASPLLSSTTMPVEELRAAFEAGRYQALAEFMPQYSGLAPNDPALEPYFAMAEELDIPVGLHVGLGPPGAAYDGSPEYRIADSDALLLEDVLIAHPKLRLYVMHAGWPLLDSIVALLYAHPQVYVDVGVIDWYVPTREFYRYLERMIDAGFSKRILFGSDQMVWPDAIARAIETVEGAPFLTDEQRRDIMCRNAMRFFRFEETVCD